MPRLSLDTAAFDDAAAACRDAAGLLQESAVLDLPPEPFAVPELVAALDDLRRAWTQELGMLAGQVDAMSSALAVAGGLYTVAETTAVRLFDGAPARLTLDATLAAIGRAW
ncbi:hypothetical protein Xcel_0120 [Xylanimonas cellulosilytica DSM 15894]|uniref:Uncharacterized protein n=1 Tax=Xylanimonas cellulosilytica (strain DSM 15894 / JCM 12276 / CECT 5975 / KCTC 9989 / LMG 20990 / NBRC 107835 / XIL07) TaxID=446471 RepID=D1BTZ7_XYLCX|nr:hypothetical protein [Xylanimonas cellulosilytica]ACZ29161.1 hypothetical protein Xcel_0120 [Xylanimonas cellulosilytica DSM 15894]